MSSEIRPLIWTGASLRVLDQRRLPGRTAYLTTRTPAAVAAAIRSMALRGAPLIGCAGAFGMVLAARRAVPGHDPRRAVRNAARVLKAARPTAVALGEMVDRMLRVAEAVLAKDGPGTRRRLLRALDAEARLIYKEDREAGLAMARHGAGLLPRRAAVITYCNTGSLATAGVGTALGVIKEAHRRGKIGLVYACETRPYMQGSRLTAWELRRAGIPFFLLTDNMAGHILATERIDAVLVGADRIAANGDVANKIGTYPLAVLARAHRVPFYVVAPTATLDPAARSGADIPIEERPAGEVLRLGGRSLAPAGARARHPAFDVTPSRLVSALVTERGVSRKAKGETFVQAR